MDQDPPLDAQSAKLFDIALAMEPKPEILADDNFFRLESGKDNVLEKLSASQTRKRAVEGGNEDHFNTKFFQPGQPLSQCLDHEDLFLAEDSFWMGRKGQDKRKKVSSVGSLDEEAEDGLMTQMEPIKIPDGYSCRPGEAGETIETSQDKHRVRA